MYLEMVSNSLRFDSVKNELNETLRLFARFLILRVAIFNTVCVTLPIPAATAYDGVGTYEIVATLPPSLTTSKACLRSSLPIISKTVSTFFNTSKNFSVL
ncbi:hypothetical protein D3C78_1429500 [compost metagenome]